MSFQVFDAKSLADGEAALFEYTPAGPVIRVNPALEVIEAKRLVIRRSVWHAVEELRYYSLEAFCRVAISGKVCSMSVGRLKGKARWQRWIPGWMRYPTLGRWKLPTEPMIVRSVS